MAIINKGMSRRSFLGLTGSVAAVAGLGLTGWGGGPQHPGRMVTALTTRVPLPVPPIPPTVVAA